MAPELCVWIFVVIIHIHLSLHISGWLFVLHLNSLASLNEVIVFECIQWFWLLFVFFIMEVMLSNLFTCQSRNWKSGRLSFNISASKRPIILFIFPLQELLTWPYLNTNESGAYSPQLGKYWTGQKVCLIFSITPYEKP